MPDITTASVASLLTDAGLRRRVDASDVFQSVLGSFFVRAQAGQYDLDDPAQLVALLRQMARNKQANQARFHRRGCRDVRRVGGDADDVAAPAADAPDRVAADRELLAAVRSLLGPDERAVADRRAGGATWEEIAAGLGGTAEYRKQGVFSGARPVDTRLRA